MFGFIEKVLILVILSLMVLPASFATQMEIKPNSFEVDSRASFEKVVNGSYFGGVSLEQLIGPSAVQMLEGKEYTEIQIDGTLTGSHAASVSIQFFPQGPVSVVQINPDSHSIHFNNLSSAVHRNSLRFSRVHFSSSFYVEKMIIRFDDYSFPNPEYSYRKDIYRNLNYGETLTIGYWGIPELQRCALKKFAVFVSSPIGIVDYSFLFNFGSTPQVSSPYARAFLNTRSAWEIAGTAGGILGVTTPYDSFSIVATSGPIHVQQVLITCRR